MRLGVLLMIGAIVWTSGCATNPAQKAAERQACEKLVAAAKTALDTGSAPLDAETAAFARKQGLQMNIIPDQSGTGERLVPKSLPFILVLAADPKDGGPQYRAALR